MNQAMEFRPDLDSYDRATRLEFSAVVRRLQDVLGSRLVAYIAGVRETRTVREWGGGAGVKKGDVEPRLRMTLRIAQMIADRDGARVAQSWFQGLNPDLDDRSPARLLREEDLDDVGPRTLAAARNFVAEAGSGLALGGLLWEKKSEILQVAARHGASNVRVFGSVARGEDSPTSDADFLVEFEAGRSLIDQGLLAEDLQNLLGCSVHVVEPQSLHPVIRDEVLDEAVPL
jgi:predicted nucleotidyltransferase